MQDYSRDQQQKIYGKIRENQPGAIHRFFSAIFTGCFTCGCLVVLFLAIITAAAIYFFSSSSPSASLVSCNPLTKSTAEDSFSEKYVSGTVNASNRIGVIEVHGMITSDRNASLSYAAISEKIIQQLEKAMKDDTVKALIIDLDTPGGEVTASDEIYKKILEVRKKKPVVAMMNTLCASGGYYIAAGCSPIVANKFTLTGSIGVIISTWNYKGLFDRIGLQSEVYTSGKMKDMLHGGKVRTPEEIALVNTLVTNAYDEFVKIVSASRKIPAEKIKNSPIGDGRVMDGKQALQYALVDSLGYFEDAVRLAAQEAKLKEYQVFRYEESFSFGKLFDLISVKSPAVRLILPSPGTKQECQIRKGVLYFLPSAY